MVDQFGSMIVLAALIDVIFVDACLEIGELSYLEYIDYTDEYES